MGYASGDAGRILESCIDGFHRYRLEAPAHPDYVSESLCAMIGCTADDLIGSPGDALAERVHPEDRSAYRAFLGEMAAEERRMTLRYRLVRTNGTVLYIQESMTSRRSEQGDMQGFAVLTDVSDLHRENRALHALNVTVPCGIVKYTCSENPRVTYVNQRMLKMLRMPDDTPEALAQIEQHKSNVYLFISPEERDRFRRFLEQVYASDEPVAGEITALRGDGTRMRLYGWICKMTGEDGQEEFQSICIDVTDRYERKHAAEQRRYLRALSQVYDEIAEFDLQKGTVRFLQGHYYEKLGRMAEMPMLLEDTVRLWIDTAVVEEDQERIRAAFEELLGHKTFKGEERLLQTEFRARFSDGTIRDYLGVFLWMNESGGLFCCRNITHQQEADRLRAENSALRSIAEQMRQLVMHYTDGMLAFEIQNDCVRPLYISDNICRFFGYGREEWLSVMQSMTPIRDFVSKCHIAYDDFLELLENREGEFHYADVMTHETHRMRALCTSCGYGEDQRNYVVLYDVTGKESAAQSDDSSAVPNVYVRTFGYFDVFIDGSPIAFRNEKAKELFALLVDRRGGFVSSAEAIAVLWEDEPASPVTLARYRKVALRLKNTLEEYGIADVVESVDGKRRIVSQRIRCDLYDYLSAEPQYAQLFKGSYLQNYSWGEMTLAELSGWKES